MNRRSALWPATLLCFCVFTAFSAVRTMSADQTAAAEHYKKGVELKNADNKAGALEEFRLAVKNDPDNSEYRFNLGFALMEQDKLQDAVAELEAATAGNPQFADALKFLGITYSKLKDHPKALDAFKRALAITPDDAVIQNDAGQVSYMLKNVSEAEAYLNRAIELDPNLAVAYINLINVHVEKKAFDKAIETGIKAIELAPDDSVARNNLSYAYFKNGDIKNAYEQMRKAVELDPGNKSLAQNLKYLEGKVNSPGAGEQAPPSSGNGKMPREITLREVQQKRQAEGANGEAPSAEQQPAATPKVKALKPESKPEPPKKQAEQPAPAAKAEQAAPQQPTVASAPAAPAAPKQLKREKKAEPPAKVEESKTRREETLDTRADKEKKFTDKNFETAKMKTKERRFDSAEYYVGKALDADPVNPNFLTLEAIIKDLQGFNQLAMTKLEDLTAKQPGSQAFNALGHVYQTLGRYDKAAEHYTRAHDMDRSNACATANLGSVRLLEGASGANTLLRIGLELGCRSGGAMNNLAFARWLDGDDYGAVQLIREALKAAPDNPIIRENASFIQSRAPKKFNPVTIEMEQPKPFPPPARKDKTLTLDSLVPVEPIRYHEYFESRYETKKIAVVPFRDTIATRAPGGASPAREMTLEMEETLKGNKYFRVERVDGIEAIAGEMENPSRTAGFLKRSGVDILISAAPGRFKIEDGIEKKWLGLKRRTVVTGRFPFNVRMIDAKTGETFFEGEVTGEEEIFSTASHNLGVREKRDLKSRAFDNFCDRVSAMLTDSYNLLPQNEPAGLVQYRIVRPPGFIRKTYP